MHTFQGNPSGKYPENQGNIGSCEEEQSTWFQVNSWHFKIGHGSRWKEKNVWTGFQKYSSHGTVESWGCLSTFQPKAHKIQTSTAYTTHTHTATDIFQRQLASTRTRMYVGGSRPKLSIYFHSLTSPFLMRVILAGLSMGIGGNVPEKTLIKKDCH